MLGIESTERIQTDIGWYQIEYNKPCDIIIRYPISRNHVPDGIDKQAQQYQFLMHRFIYMADKDIDKWNEQIEKDEASSKAIANIRNGNEGASKACKGKCDYTCSHKDKIYNYLVEHDLEQ